MYKKITEDVSSRQDDLNVAGYQLLSYWQKIVFSIPSFWKNALFNKPQFCTEESFSNWRKGLIASLLWNGNDSHDFINISWVPMVNPIFCEILSFSLNFPFKGHGCSLNLQNQDSKLIFGILVYQRPVTISKSRSRCKTPVRNHQHLEFTHVALEGAGGSWLAFGILILILIWSMVFDIPMIQILALYLDFEGAKNIHVL